MLNEYGIAPYVSFVRLKNGKVVEALVEKSLGPDLGVGSRVELRKHQQIDDGSKHNNLYVHAKLSDALFNEDLLFQFAEPNFLKLFQKRIQTGDASKEQNIAEFKDENPNLPEFHPLVFAMYNALEQAKALDDWAKTLKNPYQKVLVNSFVLNHLGQELTRYKGWLKHPTLILLDGSVKNPVNTLREMRGDVVNLTESFLDDVQDTARNTISSLHPAEQHLICHALIESPYKDGVESLAKEILSGINQGDKSQIICVGGSLFTRIANHITEPVYEIITQHRTQLRLHFVNALYGGKLNPAGIKPLNTEKFKRASEAILEWARTDLVNKPIAQAYAAIQIAEASYQAQCAYPDQAGVTESIENDALQLFVAACAQMNPDAKKLICAYVLEEQYTSPTPLEAVRSIVEGSLDNSKVYIEARKCLPHM